MNARVFLAIVSVSSTATASTYHVATTGNDTANGSVAAPWKTIQRAANAVSAGDTVVIHAGTYTGFLVDTSGTQAAPITFSGDGVVNINGAATTDRDAVHIDGASWIVVEGLIVTGATRAGISAENCDHVTVRKNTIAQNGRWGVFSSFCDDLVVEDNDVSRSGTEHGVYASNSADRPIIRRNKIWGNGMCGVHMNGDINYGGDGVISGAIVEANIITNNGALGGSAINGDGITNATIRNNVLDGNHASGVSLYRIDGGAPSTGNLVINNTIRMASDARWAINIQNGSTGNTLRNNILLHPSSSRGAVDLCSTCATGLVSNNNAVVGRFLVNGTMTDLTGWRTKTGDAASFVASEAQLFTSASDLRLAATSPAIDKGAAMGAPATDVLGVARPQGAAIDVGAYERCEGTCVGGDGDGGDDSDGSGSGSGDGAGSDDTSGDDTGSDGDDYSGPVLDDPEAGGCTAVHPPGLAIALLALFRCRRRRRKCS